MFGLHLRELRTNPRPGPLRFAVGAQLAGGGRLLVLADHSIFINDMMLQTDNDNIPFAFNVVRWLTDAGNGQRRTDVLFYDDGQITLYTADAVHATQQIRRGNRDPQGHRAAQPELQELPDHARLSGRRRAI